ncbi:MAG TPA: arylesterase [Usitatibacter sp.]|jgi:acyl-CoA thioesterase-1|nr:arylesterase [Usitatibacter sp.]
MRSRFLAFLRAAVAVASLAAAWPSAAANTLLVFGDSLSAAYGINPGEGWVQLVADRIRQQGLPWQVVNASVSGETTAGGLRRLPEDLKRHHPSIVAIELGANDALRGQPIAGIRSNLEQMIRLVRSAHAEPVLVGIMIPPNYGIDYAAEFRQLYADLARKERVPLVPFLLAGLVDKPDMFQADQLHPTAQAQPRVVDNVWPTLEPLLARRKP